MAAFNLQANISIRKINADVVIKSLQSSLAKHKFKINVELDNIGKSNLGTVQRDLAKVNKETQRLGTTTKQTTQYVSRHSEALDGVGTSAKVSAVGLTILGAAVLTLNKAVKSGISFMIEYETALAQISSVSGLSGKPLKEIGDLATDIGVKFGVPIEKSLDLYNNLLRAGVAVKDLKKNAELLGKLSLNPEFTSSDQLGKMFTQLQTFGGSVENNLNRAVLVSKEFDAEISTLADSLKVGGSLAKSSGQDFSSFAATVGIVAQKTKAEGSRIGRALKSLTANMQNVKTVSKNLKALNVELYDNDQFVGYEIALQRIVKAVKEYGIGSKKANDILLNLAGKNHINILTEIVNSYDQIKAKTNELRKISGTSIIDKDAALIVATTANAIERLTAQYHELSKSVAESKGLQALKDILEGSASAALKLGDTLAEILPALGLLAGGAALKKFGGPAASLMISRGFASRGFIEKGAGGKGPGDFRGGGVRTEAINRQLVITGQKFSSLDKSLGVSTYRQKQFAQTTHRTTVANRTAYQRGRRDFQVGMKRISASSMGAATALRTTFTRAVTNAGRSLSIFARQAARGNPAALGKIGTGLAIGGMMAASAMPEGGLSDAISTGVSTGLMAGFLTSNPLIGVGLGMTAALLSLRKTIKEDTEKREVSEGEKNIKRYFAQSSTPNNKVALQAAVQNAVESLKRDQATELYQTDATRDRSLPASEKTKELFTQLGPAIVDYIEKAAKKYTSREEFVKGEGSFFKKLVSAQQQISGAGKTSEPIGSSPISGLLEKLYEDKTQEKQAKAAQKTMGQVTAELKGISIGLKNNAILKMDDIKPSDFSKPNQFAKLDLSKEQQLLFSSIEKIFKDASPEELTELKNSTKELSNAFDQMRLGELNNLKLVLSQQTAVQTAQARTTSLRHQLTQVGKINKQPLDTNKQAITAAGGNAAQLTKIYEQLKRTKDDPKTGAAIKILVGKLNILASATNRLQKSTSELIKINKTIAGRESFAERFLSGDADQRQKFIADINLAKQFALQPQLFKNATIETQRKVLDIMNNKLQGLDNVFGSGKSTQELKSGMLQGTIPQLFQGPNRQKQNVENEQKGILADSIEASKTLTKIQEDIYADYLWRLSKINRDFLNELRDIFRWRSKTEERDKPRRRDRQQPAQPVPNRPPVPNPAQPVPNRPPAQNPAQNPAQPPMRQPGDWMAENRREFQRRMGGAAGNVAAAGDPVRQLTNNANRQVPQDPRKLIKLLTRGNAFGNRNVGAIPGLDDKVLTKMLQQNKDKKDLFNRSGVLNTKYFSSKQIRRNVLDDQRERESRGDFGNSKMRDPMRNVKGRVDIRPVEPSADWGILSNSFTAVGTVLKDAAALIPKNIEMTGRVDANIVINGAAVLQEMEPGIRNMIMNAINEAWGNVNPLTGEVSTVAEGGKTISPSDLRRK